MSWTDRGVPRGQSLWYRLVVEGHDGWRDASRSIAVETKPGPALELLAPLDPGDGQPVVLRYRMRARAAAMLEIFDAAGRRIHSFDEGIVDPGLHARTWDRRSRSGAEVAAGVYFVHLQVESQARTQRLVLVHH